MMIRAAKFRKVVKPLWDRARALPRLLWRKETSSVEHMYANRHTALSPEKQKQLEKLCHELFKRKELITSGRLQLIGLSLIKKRMGKKWAGLCQLVYETTEDVIRQHMEHGDIFIRYQDDTYIILFAHATFEQGVKKSKHIAEEIRRRLFAIDDKELRQIEIRRAVNTMRADRLFDRTFEDFMGDILNREDESFSAPVYSLRREDEQPAAGTPPAATQIETRKFYPIVTGPDKESMKDMKNIRHAYLPLWDIKRKALTSYMLLTYGQENAEQMLTAHMTLCRACRDKDKLALDLEILDRVKAELAGMEEDGRKFLLVCPVQYESLHKYESYEIYKQACMEIPQAHRQYLVFMILIPQGDIPQRNAYWFAKPLRVYCRQVFAEIPLPRDINFGYLRNTGVDAVGVCLNDSIQESVTINRLNSLVSKAKKNKIPFGFVLGVKRLSLTSSVICGGFDYLGGPLIHDPVEKPDSVHKFNYEDLLKGLV